MLAGPQIAAESLRFLDADQISSITETYGTPVYVYDEPSLIRQALAAKAFPAPYGLTVRYALKANPLKAILRVFKDHGLNIDASSGAEVTRAVQAGYQPSDIMLTSQQLPTNLEELVKSGVLFNASSLHQLDTYGRLFPGHEISIRLNSGLGSGHTRGVAVAGPSSSFGIWYEHLPEVIRLITRHHLKLTTIHSHIGCGTDPKVWKEAALKTLDIIAQLPTVSHIDLGGGFKVARMPNEIDTDMQALGASISKYLTGFAKRTSRKLHLEIEPGTFLVANCGTLLASVEDIVSTGPQGYEFLKLNTGMNDFLRPALHASQHPISVIGSGPRLRSYVVVGHNCESTDLLTPSPDDALHPLPRELAEAKIGDTVAIEGVGAYCSAMSITGYNSFATPNEVMITSPGKIKLINRSIGIAEFTATEL